ncbi:MAG: hypothetical protein LCH26_04205 [Proteobacteria bacterium]|nr:hypothetical protein [Pseudomonadota bacterium]
MTKLWKICLVTALMAGLQGAYASPAAEEGEQEKKPAAPAPVIEDAQKQEGAAVAGQAEEGQKASDPQGAAGKAKKEKRCVIS